MKIEHALPDARAALRAREARAASHPLTPRARHGGHVFMENNKKSKAARCAPCSLASKGEPAPPRAFGRSPDPLRRRALVDRRRRQPRRAPPLPRADVARGAVAGVEELLLLARQRLAQLRHVPI